MFYKIGGARLGRSNDTLDTLKQLIYLIVLLQKYIGAINTIK